MNRRKQVMIAGVTFLILSMVGTAWAVPITLKEVFLGGKGDANGFSMQERSLTLPDSGIGNKAIFNFDLTGSGGEAQLFRGASPADFSVLPTRDETGFDPAMYMTPYMAYVDFFISDLNFGGTPEKVRIDIEGDRAVTRSFTLENDPDGQKKVRVDLDNLGLLDLLSDGELMAMAISPAFGSVDNAFFLDRVVLYAEAAAAPVPEPATMLLLGTGLMGMAVARRRAKKS